MAIGKKTGGRVKGTPNRETRTVAAILESVGCNPILGMATIAMDSKQSPELRGKMFAVLAEYRYPKLKSLELSGPGGGPVELNVSPAEIFARRIDSLATRQSTGGSPSGSDG